MSLFGTPERHAANPPASWSVVKASERCWQVAAAGAVLETHATQRDALAARESGSLVTLYEREGRWYAGEAVTGWRPYADVLAGSRRTHDRFHGTAIRGCQFCDAP